MRYNFFSRLYSKACVSVFYRKAVNCVSKGVRITVMGRTRVFAMFLYTKNELFGDSAFVDWKPFLAECGLIRISII